MSKCFLLLLTLSISIYSQLWSNWYWHKTYGHGGFDKGSMAIQNDRGEYIVIGTVDTSRLENNYDIWLLRLDSLGDTIQTMIYGNTNINEIGVDIIQLSITEYLVLGSKGPNAWFFKVSTYNGDFLYKPWEKIISSDDGSDIYPIALLRYDANNCLILLRENKNGALGIDGAQVIKIDNAGNIIWRKKYSRGDAYYAEPAMISLSQEKGFAITGYTCAVDSTGNTDIWLLKVDSLGNVQWDKRYDGGTHKDDKGNSLVNTTDNGFMVTGYIVNTDRKAFLLRTDSIGNKLFLKSYLDKESIPSIATLGKSITKTKNGKYVLTGQATISGMGAGYDRDLWTFYADENGDSIRSCLANMPWVVNCGNHVFETNDGSILVTGIISDKQSTINNGNLWVIKYHSYNDMVSLEHITSAPSQGSIVISPNPFTSSTKISFNSIQENTIFGIYDIKGNLILSSKNSGSHVIYWNTINLPSGIFILKINGLHNYKTCRFLSHIK